MTGCYNCGATGPTSIDGECCKVATSVGREEKTLEQHLQVIKDQLDKILLILDPPPLPHEKPHFCE